MFRNTSKLNIISDQQVAHKTVCHDKWYTETAVYAKKIFIPIPGAITKGLRVNNTIVILPKAEIRIVIVTSALLGIPVVAKILGLMTMM